MSLRTRKLRTPILVAAASCLLAAFGITTKAQTPTPTPVLAPSPRPSSFTCPPPNDSPDVAPLIIKLSVFYKQGDQPWQPGDAVKQISRRPFFLSTSAFDLDKLSSLGPVPSRKSYYTAIKASTQLISWLETNNCDTVYCRALLSTEVTCAPADATCVPEFVKAYEAAKSDLKGSSDFARRWVTNYAPLNTRELRVGFYEAKKRWLEAALAKLQPAAPATGRIISAMTDRLGLAYFYDLCPGTYYISSIAPIEIRDGESIRWQTGAITLKKKEVSTVTAINLGNVEPAEERKKGKSYFVGRKVIQSTVALRMDNAK